METTEMDMQTMEEKTAMEIGLPTFIIVPSILNTTAPPPWIGIILRPVLVGILLPPRKPAWKCTFLPGTVRNCPSSWPSCKNQVQVCNKILILMVTRTSMVDGVAAIVAIHGMGSVIIPMYTGILVLMLSLMHALELKMLSLLLLRHLMISRSAS